MAHQKCIFPFLFFVFAFSACKTALTPPQKLHWHTEEQALLGTPLSLNEQDYVFSLGLANQKPLLAFGHHVLENQELTLASWENSTFRWRKALHHSQFDCLDVVFSPDDQFIATASTDGFVRIFHTNGTQPVRHFFEGAPVTRLTFAPSGKSLAVGTQDGFIRILETSTLKTIAQTRVSFGTIRGIAFETENTLLVADEQATLYRFKLSEAAHNAFMIRAASMVQGNFTFLMQHAHGAVIATWQNKLERPVARSQWVSKNTAQEETLLTPQGERLIKLGVITGLQMGPWTFKEMTVAICDSCLPEGVDLMLPNPRPWGFQLFANETTKVIEIESLPKAEDSITALESKGARLIEDRRFQLPGPATDLIIQPQLNKVLITYSHEPAIRSVRIYEMEQNNQLPPPSPQSGATLFDLSQWQAVRSFVGHKGFTVTGALSADGQWVATGGWDKKLLVFNAQTGLQVSSKSLSGILQKARFSNDNKVLAVGLWSPGSSWTQKPALLVYPITPSE